VRAEAVILILFAVVMAAAGSHKRKFEGGFIVPGCDCRTPVAALDRVGAFAETSIATALGDVGVNVSRRITIRIFHCEYVSTHLFRSWLHNHRPTSGAGFGLL
jgi:hypothetical protein